MSSTQAKPWWKFGHVWLVIAGPLIVVVAGFFTLYLAVRTPDPVLTIDTARRGGEPARSAETADGALAPAVQARNHAATGGTGAPAKP